MQELLSFLWFFEIMNKLLLMPWKRPKYMYAKGLKLPDSILKKLHKCMHFACFVCMSNYTSLQTDYFAITRKNSCIIRFTHNLQSTISIIETLLKGRTFYSGLELISSLGWKEHWIFFLDKISFPYCWKISHKLYKTFYKTWTNNGMIQGVAILESWSPLRFCTHFWMND